MGYELWSGFLMVKLERLFDITNIGASDKASPDKALLI
jgi:hypothetical protein